MNRIPLPRATLVQLRSFEAVARLGSVTRAAQALHLAQPTVSTQLRELAAGLGRTLLEPVGRGVRLTDAGVEVQELATSLFERFAAFEEAGDARAGRVRGRLRIAGVTTSEYFVARLLQGFLARYPEVEVELAVENRGNVVRRLERSEDDCAIMMLPPDDLALDAVPFLPNPLVAIAAADHRWAVAAKTGRRALGLAPFLAADLLLREPGSGTRRVTELHAAAHGLAIEPRMTLGSNEAIKHAVAAGLGVAIVSRHALADDPAREGLAIVKVRTLPIRRAWQVVWRRDRHRTRAARAFVEHVGDGTGIGPATGGRR